MAFSTLKFQQNAGKRAVKLWSETQVLLSSFSPFLEDQVCKEPHFLGCFFCPREAGCK